MVTSVPEKKHEGGVKSCQADKLEASKKFMINVLVLASTLSVRISQLEGGGGSMNKITTYRHKNI
jgi:hypothetical protein